MSAPRFSCTAGFLLLAVRALATQEEGRVETIGALAAAPPALAAALTTTGWSALRADGSPTLGFWPARTIERLGDGILVGAVRLTVEGQDVRGRSIPPGLYTLRFASIPEGDRHGRCLRNPDFLVLIRAVDDVDSSPRLSYHEMTTLSAKIANGHHPIVWQAQRGTAPPGGPTLTPDTAGNELLTVLLDVKGGRLALSIPLHGSLSR